MVAVAGATLMLTGCEQSAAPTARTMLSHGNEGDIYLQSVSDTLNNLPEALDLELLPAQPILTASTSRDGKEVRAICTRNPANPEGPINYLHAVDGNAGFQSLDVKPGDIVRYYVNFDEEAAQQNFEQRTALELRVRRLDAVDPENVLILDGAGLNAPALDPQRIEIWRYSDKRMDAIRSRINVYLKERRPPAGWEPSPDLAALQQVVERANQWLRNAEPAENAQWKATPLVAQLPLELRNADGVKTVISRDELADGVFAEWEGRLLEQAVWCRDISQWVRRDAVTDLDAAVALFDWTVRNIQLDPPLAQSPAAVMIHHPWQAIVYGHGTAAHRTWVFIELCRQQGIDAVAIQPQAADKPAPLLAGALIEDELYLFDPELGLPLPGGEQPVGTLAELAGDDALLREFDVADEFTYPLSAQQLDEVTAFVAASPLQLSQRSARLEAGLEGEDYVKLAVDADELVSRVAKLPHVARAALWETPFQAIADEFTLPMTESKPFRPLAVTEFQPFAERPLLWKARVMHFQGNKGKRAADRSDPLAEEREGHLDALRLYQDRTVRPPDAMLEKLEPAKQAVYGATKAAASYWVGLLSYDRGNFDVAASWIKERSLDREPDGKWANGARYNLARTYEKLGRVDEAIKLLESDPTDAPQRHGNLVRANQLAAEKSDQ